MTPNCVSKLCHHRFQSESIMVWVRKHRNHSWCIPNKISANWKCHKFCHKILIFLWILSWLNVYMSTDLPAPIWHGSIFHNTDHVIMGLDCNSLYISQFDMICQFESLEIESVNVKLWCAFPGVLIKIWSLPNFNEKSSGFKDENRWIYR